MSWKDRHRINSLTGDQRSILLCFQTEQNTAHFPLIFPGVADAQNWLTDYKRAIPPTLLPPFRSLSSLMIFLLKQRACSQATHAVLYDHLKNTMLALFDQRSNHNVKLLPYKEKKSIIFSIVLVRFLTIVRGIYKIQSEKCHKKYEHNAPARAWHAIHCGKCSLASSRQKNSLNLHTQSLGDQ